MTTSPHIFVVLSKNNDRLYHTGIFFLNEGPRPPPPMSKLSSRTALRHAAQWNQTAACTADRKSSCSGIHTHPMESPGALGDIHTPTCRSVWMLIVSQWLTFFFLAGKKGSTSGWTASCRSASPSRWRTPGRSSSSGRTSCWGLFCRRWSSDLRPWPDEPKR